MSKFIQKIVGQVPFYEMAGHLFSSDQLAAAVQLHEADADYVTAYKIALGSPNQRNISLAIDLAVKNALEKQAPRVLEEHHIEAIRDAMQWGLNGCKGYSASKAVRSFAVLSNHPAIRPAII